jgi:hypothetical protein
MQYRSLLSSLSRISGLRQSNHFGAIFALSLTLILSACGGGGSSVTENTLAEPGSDGIAPTLLSVSIKQSKTREASADGSLRLPSVALPQLLPARLVIGLLFVR